MKTKEFVSIIFDTPGGLVLQRRDDKTDIFAPGKMGLFGGSVEEGETPEEAMAREVSEEAIEQVDAIVINGFRRYQFEGKSAAGKEVLKVVHVFYSLVETDMFNVREGSMTVLDHDTDFTSLDLLPHTDEILHAYLAR